MPQEKMPSAPQDNKSSATAACSAAAAANTPCARAKAPGNPGFMPRCLNCRREVEASMSRIGGRQLRKLRAMPECAAEHCASFLSGIRDDAIRMHLASMAWWRFSAAGDGVAAPVLRVLSACKAKEPGSGAEYMHGALRVLSPLSRAQLAVWFGCENLYQAAAIFTGDRPALMGRHCMRCRLYKQGCTEYDKLGADDCPLWGDAFVQAVAAAVRRAGGAWHDPCHGIQDDGKEVQA